MMYCITSYLFIHTLGLHKHQLIFDQANYLSHTAKAVLSELIKYAAGHKYILFSVNVGVSLQKLQFVK